MGILQWEKYKRYFFFFALLNEQKCQNRQCRRVSASPRYWMVSKKKHKNTFPLSYFCMTKRRVQGGEATSERRRRDGVYQKSHKVVPALCILPASSRFASYKQPSPSSANIASEPSDRSLTAATGSKRPRADSDLLLCHVRLWRTSRELTDSRKRTRSASPRQGVQFWVLVWVRI